VIAGGPRDHLNSPRIIQTNTRPAITAMWHTKLAPGVECPRRQEPEPLGLGVEEHRARPQLSGRELSECHIGLVHGEALDNRVNLSRSG